MPTRPLGNYDVSTALVWNGVKVIDVSIIWVPSWRVNSQAADDGFGAGELAVAHRDHRGAAPNSWGGAPGLEPLAGRLPGPPGIERGRRQANALIGPGAQHRLGTEPAVASPPADGGASPHPPPHPRYRQPRRHAPSAHARSAPLPAPDGSTPEVLRKHRPGP